MIGASPLGIFSLFIMISPILLGITVTIFLCFLIKILFYKLKYQQQITTQVRLKHKVVFPLLIVLLIGTSSASIFLYSIHREVSVSSENKDRRSRFILPVDYKFDGFIFPKGTLINTDNLHDAGDRYRYLTLTALEQAKFQKPVKIANVWASAIKIESDFEFLVQLVKDQNISPVYILGDHGEMKRDPERASIECKKDQIAAFTVPSNYYPDTNYELKNWYALEYERFEPKLWLFKGCFTAPPIYVERPYPQSKLFDIMRMSEVTVSFF